MRDLTTGPVRSHLLGMAAPIAAGMLMQTLYYLVDLYFVGRLGDAALAGVGAAGNVMMIVIALTQVLGVGTVALIAQAVGRRDAADANHVFNQSLSIAALLGAITLVAGYLFTDAYLDAVAADAATIAAGRSYLYWFLPGMALQFALVAMSSALRGTGIVKPTMIVQMATVLLNVVLAPVLIAGWGTGRGLGVAGAGLASTIAVAAGVLLLFVYFRRLEKYVAVDRAQWAPRLATWRRMLGLGLPAGGEFLLMFVYVAIIYWVIRDFGAAAQAGFGVGQRVMQAIMLPALALSFAVPAVAGQNVGAKRPDRVRETFRSAAIMSTVLMVALTLLCQLRPAVAGPGFYGRSGGGRGRGWLPAGDLTQLRRVRADLRLLGDVPGARKHTARARKQRGQVAHLCRAGGLAGRLASAPHRARLVSVSCERCAAGRDQPTSAAPRAGHRSFRRSSSACRCRRT